MVESNLLEKFIFDNTGCESDEEESEEEELDENMEPN